MAQRLTKWIWILAILFILVGIPLIFLKSNISAIDDIRCKTQYGPCDEIDEEKLKEFYGQNLFLVGSHRVEERLKQNFQNRNVYVQKVFPKKLVVILDRRKPFIALTNEVVTGVFLLDVEGVVMGISEESPLPVLVLWRDVNFVVGSQVDDKTKQASQILFATKRAQQAEKGEYKNQKDDFFTVVLPNNIKVYYPFERDPAVLIGALQLILTRSRIDGKMPGSIDLRYSNPVLRY